MHSGSVAWPPWASLPIISVTSDGVRRDRRGVLRLGLVVALLPHLSLGEERGEGGEGPGGWED